MINMKRKQPLKGQVQAIEKETGIDRDYVRAILRGKKTAGVKTAFAIVQCRAAGGRWTLQDLRPDLSAIYEPKDAPRRAKV